MRDLVIGGEDGSGKVVCLEVEGVTGVCDGKEGCGIIVGYVGLGEIGENLVECFIWEVGQGSIGDWCRRA